MRGSKIAPRLEGALMKRRDRIRLALAGLLALAVVAPPQDVARGQAEDEATIAASLAAMLRAGRTVVSNYQTQINDPLVGDKGLGSAVFLRETVAIYRQTTGVDPAAIDPASRHGRLLRA